MRRCGEHVVDGVHRVDEPDPWGLHHVDHPPGEHEVLRASRADEPCEPLGPADAGDHAEQDLRLAHLRVVRGEAQVTGERELTATTECVARDDRDRDHREGGEAVQRGLHDPGRSMGLILPPVEELTHVRARGERSRTATHQQRTDIVTLSHFGHDRSQLAPRGEVERVEGRTIDHDRPHAGGSVDLEPHRRPCHAARPRPCTPRTGRSAHLGRSCALAGRVRPPCRTGGPAA